MIKEPKLIRQFLSPNEITHLRSMVSQVKQSGNFMVDDDFFYRKYIHNPPELSKLHLFLSGFVSKIIKEELKPSYSFVSMYEVGQGICPLHVDRSLCHLTVDICLENAQPWPIYVNHTTPYRSEAEVATHAEEIRKGSVEYILNPGDALIYSGTDHPHWRNKIQENNFCDLVFFHFVKKSFQG